MVPRERELFYGVCDSMACMVSVHDPTPIAGMGTLLDAIMAGRPSGREGHPATSTQEGVRLTV